MKVEQSKYQVYLAEQYFYLVPLPFEKDHFTIYKGVTVRYYLLIIFVECTCDPKGAERGDQCAHNPNGDCRCKTGVIGPECKSCKDGFYGFGQDSEIGCRSKTE